MPVRTGTAEWKGDLREGSGTVTVSSGLFNGSYSFVSRFEDESGRAGTNPEELIGAAHAACYSMALANLLSQKGYIADLVHTEATVRLERQEGDVAITRIDLRTSAQVPGISPEDFQAEAAAAKAGCPVSRALAAVEITLDAQLA